MMRGGDGVDALLGVLRDDQVLSGEEAARWAPGRPTRAVAFPEDGAQLEALVCASVGAGCALLPAGFGGWLAAGGWTRPDAVVVSTERLGGVRRYEPADLTLTVGAGTGFDALNEVAGERGQWLPVAAPGIVSGTVGAAVACGGSGPLRGRYGAMRDNVLGVEVVTGEGKRLRLGGRVVKNVAGYDLVRLMTGSRGSLGLITEASFRLYPTPAADHTLRIAAPWEGAVSVARAVATSGVPVASVEVVEREGGAEDTGLGGQVAVRLLGGEKEVEACSRRIRDHIDASGDVSGGARLLAPLDGEASRRFHARATHWEDGARLVVRLRALPDRLASSLAIGRSVLMAVAGGGARADALSGLVRIRGLQPNSDEDALGTLLTEARAGMHRMGGTMTLSQAPDGLAGRVGWTAFVGEDGGLAGRIKSIFDPHGVFAAAVPTGRSFRG